MKTNDFEIICPHCKDCLIIESINCGIFRHGCLKINLTQINPHLKKEDCDELINNNLIYGCGKPFRLIIINNEIVAEICDYI